MPLYFMHIRNSDGLIEDPDGIELPDLEAAKEEAILSARDIVGNQIKDGHVITGQFFEVWRDGEKVAVVDFFKAINHP